MSRKFQIGIIGSAGPEEYVYTKPLKEMYEVSFELGQQLAKRGAIVVTGGKGGVMEMASKGAGLAGGITVAEISGAKRCSANRYVDIEVVTYDEGYRGPSQLVGMCDGLVALGGGAGTLQELCVAYRMKKPIVLLTGFGGWVDRIAKLDYLDERKSVRFVTSTTAKDAIGKLYRKLEESNLFLYPASN